MGKHHKISSREKARRKSQRDVDLGVTRLWTPEGYLIARPVKGGYSIEDPDEKSVDVTKNA